MEKQVINETELSPRIMMDPAGKITISGKSRMEDASLFYDQLFVWLQEFAAKNSIPIIVTLKLIYFNSSSAKQLLKLLMTIEELPASGKVIWIYPKDNDILLERGQELEIMLSLPFEYVEYSGDKEHEV